MKLRKSAYLLLIVQSVTFAIPISSYSTETTNPSSNSSIIPSTIPANQAGNSTPQASAVDHHNDIDNLQTENIDANMPASIPSFMVLTSAGEWLEYNQTTVDNKYLTAKITYLGEDQWKLDLKAKQDIDRVYFPWQANRESIGALKDETFYFPFLSGVTEKAEHHDENWTWWGMDYPGSAFAPLVVMATETTARMVAAINWPPKKVTPMYAAERMVLLYGDGMKAGTSDSFGALITTVKADVSKGEVSWQQALDKYRKWLDPRMTDVNYADWMWQSEGFLEYGLNNVYHAPGALVNTQNIINNVNGLLDLWDGEIDQVQFWGQMGGYSGYIPKNSTVNPWAPEGGTCCGLNQSLFSGYGSGLIDFVHQLIEDGYHAGFYSAPHYQTDTEGAWNLDTSGGYEWLQSWLDKNKNEYGANSFYIDVLGRSYFGDPGYVMSLFDTLIPQDSIIEGVVDIYSAAGLISGSLNGGDWHGGPNHTVENSDTTTFANFGRYLLNDRIVYLGGSNGDHAFWGKFNNYWTERQVFLLGAKFDAGTVNERAADGAPILNADGSMVRNQMMDNIINLRNKVDWWTRRPEYLDTKGLTGIPDGIDIRRFQDKDGKDLIVIDNWNQIAGQSFFMDGVKLFISSDKISIIDVEKTRALSPGDANRDGHVDGADYTVWADAYGKTGINSSADFNHDGTVDGVDYSIWADYYDPQLPPNADGNHDGKIDGADYALWADHFGQTGKNIPGDFNFDKKVDNTDYAVWAEHYKPDPIKTQPPAPNADSNNDGMIDGVDYTVWADHYGQSGANIPGDFNHDGVVDGADYTVWAEHFNPPVPQSSSEPLSVVPDAVVEMPSVVEVPIVAETPIVEEPAVEIPVVEAPIVEASASLPVTTLAQINSTDSNKWEKILKELNAAAASRRANKQDDAFFSRPAKHSRFTFREE